MRKNKMMRLASVLLVAVLMTTSVISGTFAKYTTADDATDTARVAAWGVNVEATGTLFGYNYLVADDNTPTDAVVGISVKSAGGASDNVIAPGTKNNSGITLAISGTPEVMVNVNVTADLNLEGWTYMYDHDSDPGTDEVVYCPLVFNVNGTEFKINATDPNMDTIAELEAAIEAKFTELSATNVAPGTNLSTDRTVSISWSWPYSTSTENDKMDTALTELVPAPQVTFTCEATVTQVD